MSLGINFGILQSMGGGGTPSYALDELASPILVVGSWSVEKAYASNYETANDIIGVKMYTTGTEEGFTGAEVVAGDVLTWNSDTKAVITDMYDQSGNGKDMSTSTLSRMPTYIDSSTQLTLDDGSKTCLFPIGNGLSDTALGLTGTDGAVLMKIKGGNDISYRILRIAGERSPFITFVGNSSPCFSGVGTPVYEANGSSMTPATRGQLHSTVSGSDVILLIENIDWTDNANWNSGTIEMAYQGNPKISSLTIWNSAPPSGDLTIMKNSYALVT